MLLAFVHPLLQVLVTDVQVSALLMLTGKFLTKLAPLFCVPAAGFGGAASPIGAANMDEQVRRTQVPASDNAVQLQP